ncbi:hypothetical protein OROMI_000761 [Orobanche minor]
MAPNVMEQVHGHDFESVNAHFLVFLGTRLERSQSLLNFSSFLRADIWSFGI